MFAEKGDVRCGCVDEGKVKGRGKERKVGRAMGEMIVFLAFGYAGKRTLEGLYALRCSTGNGWVNR